ncbi:MAG TPA: response regulator [Nannocystaceae bacterium]|nr:response regulator [Nannocystaceae bacterium]
MSGARILVVDDNATNTKLLTFILGTRGYDVRSAEEAEGALRIIAEFEPVLILMDIQLPGMDGLTLTRLIKSNPKTRDIAVIAVTAAAMKGDDERAREAGCDAYITKPIDVRELSARVRELVARARGEGGPG